MIIEYIFLGGFAALTGLVLSYSSSWALAFFVFESVFLPTVLPFVVMISVVICLTVLIGMLNSRGILDRPPLEVAGGGLRLVLTTDAVVLQRICC